MLRSTRTLRLPVIAGVVLALTVTLTLGTGALAHHGWSGYDASKPLTLTGTIREAGYEHPHGFVKLEVADKVWVITLAPPSRMENRGLQSAALKPGTKATVMGYPNRTDPSEMRAEWIQIDGKTVRLR